MVVRALLSFKEYLSAWIVWAFFRREKEVVHQSRLEAADNCSGLAGQGCFELICLVLVDYPPCTSRSYDPWQKVWDVRKRGS